jgi:hypothetical protein
VSRVSDTTSQVELPLDLGEVALLEKNTDLHM